MRGIVIRLLVAWVLLAAGFAVADWLMDTVKIDGGFFTLLWVSLLFALVSAFIGTIIRLLALPLTILTFGLFGLVINGLLLMLTAGLTDSLDVGGLWWSIVAAIVISVVSTLLGFLVLRPETE